METIEALEVLFDDERRNQLTGELARLYGAGLGFGQIALYANFVESVDGVVAIKGVPSAGSMISGRNEADRFLMGLLRAFADAVLIGAGTMRDTPGHMWTPGHVFPPLASEFAELRKRLGRKTEPRLVLLTASGELDSGHPAIEHGALILTTKPGERKLAGRLPKACEVVALTDGNQLDLTDAVAHLRKTNYKVVLSEGGPHVIAQLLDKGLLEEIFLTISPVMAGRTPDSPRLALIEGIEFLPKAGRWAELKSVRRHGSHLFLRYAFSGS